MRVLHILLAIPLLLIAAPIAAQGNEGAAIRSFKKEFFASASKPKTAKDRREALRWLDGFDSKAVARALVAGYRHLDDEVRKLSDTRDDANEEIRAIFRGQEGSRDRQISIDQKQRYDALVDDSDRLRRLIDIRHELQIEMRERIGDIRSEDGLSWLVSNGLRDRRLPVQLKLQIAHSAGALGDRMVPELVVALKRTRCPESTCAVLEGLGFAGASSREATDRIIELLRDDDVVVRERAAWTLSRIAAPEAIEPMMALLERETGQARKRVAAALEILTGQNHGTRIASWKAWWAAEGDAYQAGHHELGQGKPSRSADSERNYYFGIPQDGQSMMYVIDASGSMAKEIDLAPSGTSSGRASLTSRLEACKAELISALGRLNSDQRFNVMWYNDQPHVFSDTMLRATGSDVEGAQEWVRKLQPVSSTNIYDSLRLAFGFIGQGAKDKHYGMELDTIFLLTDGAPTTPDGQLDSTDKILTAVREWNPLKRVTIHTIGIGGELNQPFLEQLASENGGEFRQH